MHWTSPITLAALLVATVPTGSAQRGQYRKQRGPVRPRVPRNGAKVMVLASGAQEVPPVMSDTLSRLRLTFNRDFSSAFFDLDIFDGVSISQAHLHCAAAGTNGPVVAVLLNVADVGAPGQDFNGDAARGQVDLVDDDFAANEACGVPVNNVASLYEAILQRRIYLNVHSEANPPGETRGQLFSCDDNKW